MGYGINFYNILIFPPKQKHIIIEIMNGNLPRQYAEKDCYGGGGFLSRRGRIPETRAKHELEGSAPADSVPDEFPGADSSGSIRSLQHPTPMVTRS